MIPLNVDLTIENKGTRNLVQINGIIIAKQIISHWNFKWLRGSVGRAHTHWLYVHNEEIVVRNSKSKIFFII